MGMLHLSASMGRARFLTCPMQPSSPAALLSCSPATPPHPHPASCLDARRFVRISGRMVDKMGANLSYMAATSRRSWQQIVRELGGGGDKDR